MLYAPFEPHSKSFLVDNTAPVQVVTDVAVASGNRRQYRIRSKNAGEGYIGYAAPLTSGATPTVNTTLPIVGTPQAGIIGLNGGVTETFTLPVGCWFKAAVGMTFEVIAGEGV